jgi:uncharacterized membrane protein YqjE
MASGERRQGEGIIGLARQLIGGGVRLVRLELQHGRQEVGERIGQTARGAAFLGIAAGFGLLALISLVALLIALLALVLPLWASALIWLAIFVVVGIIFALLGKNRLRSPVPEETIESVKEDIAWAKRLLRRE